ncbi:MAG: tRNA (guanosine(46)-N7)-methyltransferase TrmB [Pirellulaceae bacterium]
MGRRALRKIDPNLDLTRWLLADKDLPVPWSAEQLFGRRAPLEIEVGSGKGLFLAHATAAVPDHDFLGIEISRKYARFAAARLAGQVCENGKVVHGDGVQIFHDRLLDESVEAVHVYFPDPWWKLRHRKRRVMHAGFLSDVQRVLRPGGVLHFWTDVQEYFDTTLELIRQTTRLSGPAIPQERPSEHDLDYQTHFERRTRLTNLPVYRSEFQK